MAGQVAPRAKHCTQCGSELVDRREGDQARQACPACGWVYYPRSNVASALAIMQDGRVLMVQRKHEPFQGQWTMPSGFLEYGEDPEEAAVREAREEIGVEVALSGLLDVRVETGDPRGPCVLLTYTAHIVGGTVQAGDDASSADLFPLDSLPEKIAFKAHRLALEKLSR